MFVDAQLLLSDAQAFTATARSTNTIDTGAGLGGARNLFDGEPLALVVTVDAGAVQSGTYTFNLRTADVADFSTGVVNLISQVIDPAAITIGKKIVLPVPVGVTSKQFLELQVVTGGTSPGVTLTAFLSPLSLVDKFRTYKDNSTIS